MQRGPGVGLVGCLRRWQQWAAERGGPQGPADAVAAVADVAGRRDAAPPELFEVLVAELSVSRPVAAPDGLPSATLAAATAASVSPPHLLGLVYEAALGAAAKRRGGVFYTPASVARGLVSLACGPSLASSATRGSSALPVVADPAMGSGVFLLAAAELLQVGTGSTGAACVTALRGCDLDAHAVAVARTALAWWAWTIDGTACWPSLEALRRGDGLALPGPGGPPVAVVDVVVGNPPFLNQLQAHTARSAASRKYLQGRFGIAAKGYVDTALLFVLASLELVADGGRVVLVQPESTLVASHGAAARARIDEISRLEGLWLGGGAVFEAGVRVCAPVLRRMEGDRSRYPQGSRVRLWEGLTVTPSRTIEVDSALGGSSRGVGQWAPLLAAGRGVPTVDLRTAGSLADLAAATAGFRDQFYGLVPYVREHPEGDLAPALRPAGPAPDAATAGQHGGRWAPLVTSGLLALGRLRGGEVPVRFAGRTWMNPVVDLVALGEGDPKLYRWVAQRLRPKLLVAAQTAVVVFAPDLSGRLVPSVPVVAVQPHGGPDLAGLPAEEELAEEELAHPSIEMFWMVAAVLAAPVVSAYAATRFAGAGLTAGALRLGAKQVLSLPTPTDIDAWGEAALLLRGANHRSLAASEAAGRPEIDLAAWHRSGALMAQAFGVAAPAADSVQRWWAAAARRHLPATDGVSG